MRVQSFHRSAGRVVGLMLSCCLIAAVMAVPMAGGPTAARAAEPVAAEGDPRTDKVVRSGLPIPRFVSLRSDQVNIRTGPGVRYPVDWVFVRAGMPVEITAEFDTWRRIRDWEGTQGWVHQSMLSGRRSLVVLGGVRSLRGDPDGSAPVVAQAEPGVMGRLLKCRDDWCNVELDGIAGWLQRRDFWGTYPAEEVKD